MKFNNEHKKIYIASKSRGAGEKIYINYNNW